MLLSMDPDAIKLPVGSNFAVKISPVCPESSITGACRPLVRGCCYLGQYMSKAIV